MSLKGWIVRYGIDDKDYTNQLYIPSNKYDSCYYTDEVAKVDSNYKSDAINGFWINPLKNLIDGSGK
jgi:hypothetical protein